jgi:hypothetical protein
MVWLREKWGWEVKPTNKNRRQLGFGFGSAAISIKKPGFYYFVYV